MYLDALLADQPLTGGLEPMLGDAHLRMLTIVGFPTATTPGILDDLNRLAFPYRWSTRAIMLDKTDATKLLTRIRRQWFAKRKSIAAILKEVMTNEASVADRHRRRQQGGRRRRRAAGARLRPVGEAYVTATVTVWDEDPRIADETAAPGREGHPGPRLHLHGRDRQRGRGLARLVARPRLCQRPPAAGLDAQPRPHDPAVGGLGGAGTGRASSARRRCSLRRTEGSTPFRFSLHVGDVGHTLVVGPTGAGKSVLLALMALQFRRYPTLPGLCLRLRRLDPGRGARHGGDWHDLGGALSDSAAEPVALQPLARIDDAAERGWAADWIAAILAREKVDITPEVKEHLWSALTSLASAPVGERTLTGLSVLLQSKSLKRALQPYCLGGPFGRLLDAESRAARRKLRSRRSRPKG